MNHSVSQIGDRKLPQGKLLKNIPLARYTSWRVGGPAKRLYVPESVDDLSDFLQQLPIDEPLLWLGLGSNVLIRDSGFLGTVVMTYPGLTSLSHEDNGLLRAQAGVSCAKVARYSVRQAFMGAEFLAGIPGSVGGALAMNAGAFGGETWSIVKEVETIDRYGMTHLRKRDEYQIAYRTIQASVADEWFVAGHFSLLRGETHDAMSRIRECLDRRNATQPVNKPSCGSVFKNPDGHYAAVLIEACGLKGLQIGGAVVSDKHANFILNEQHATAKDIEDLICRIETTVQQEHGIRLEREVRIVGEEGLPVCLKK